MGNRASIGGGSQATSRTPGTANTLQWQCEVFTSF